MIRSFFTKRFQSAIVLTIFTVLFSACSSPKSEIKDIGTAWFEERYGSYDGCEGGDDLPYTPEELQQRCKIIRDTKTFTQEQIVSLIKEQLRDESGADWRKLYSIEQVYERLLKNPDDAQLKEIKPFLYDKETLKGMRCEIKIPETLPYANEVYLKFIKRKAWESCIQYAPAYMRDDKSLWMSVMQNDVDKQYGYGKGSYIEYASARLRDDKEVMIMAIRASNGRAVKFASKRLQNDPEIIAAANVYKK